MLNHLIAYKTHFSAMVGDGVTDLKKHGVECKLWSKTKMTIDEGREHFKAVLGSTGNNHNC